MKEYAERFYKSKLWQKTAEAYATSQQHLCEVCRQKGLIVPSEIVHHKVPINQKNITDPSITLAFENLQCVCRSCHAKAHDKTKRRYIIDEFGHVITKDDSPLS